MSAAAAEHLREARCRIEAVATLGAAAILNPDEWPHDVALAGMVQLADKAAAHVAIVELLAAA